MKTPHDLTMAFRSRGLKLTPQRQAIFAHMHGNRCHPTAESVYSALSVSIPGISLRTVYQTLHDLVAMGEIRQVDLGGAARFEPNVDDHHHLVCLGCGDIADVAVDTAHLFACIGEFVPTCATVIVHGHCRACQGSSATTTRC